ncbi:hypothetical protein K469DRAFT_683040 [Zopfia rhizophila CBS 207.26]|uniref:Uncharacterized protein n=1 Tax=Zopfia rhizophila CBS 207.26 TaxID=1314779 RepID=A0A6A6EEZ9_9PEZI|nr:hypothetical protein K469DRAFT_683040 [Zopfia rhizophila CBS 207.26]
MPASRPRGPNFMRETKANEAKRKERDTTTEWGNVRASTHGMHYSTLNRSRPPSRSNDDQRKEDERSAGRVTPPKDRDRTPSIYQEVDESPKSPGTEQRNEAGNLRDTVRIGELNDPFETDSINGTEAMQGSRSSRSPFLSVQTWNKDEEEFEAFRMAHPPGVGPPLNRSQIRNSWLPGASEDKGKEQDSDAYGEGELEVKDSEEAEIPGSNENKERIGTLADKVGSELDDVMADRGDEEADGERRVARREHPDKGSTSNIGSTSSPGEENSKQDDAASPRSDPLSTNPVELPTKELEREEEFETPPLQPPSGARSGFRGSSILSRGYMYRDNQETEQRDNGHEESEKQDTLSSLPSFESERARPSRRATYHAPEEVSHFVDAVADSVGERGTYHKRSSSVPTRPTKDYPCLERVREIFRRRNGDEVDEYPESWFINPCAANVGIRALDGYKRPKQATEGLNYASELFKVSEQRGRERYDNMRDQAEHSRSRDFVVRARTRSLSPSKRVPESGHRTRKVNTLNPEFDSDNFQSQVGDSDDQLDKEAQEWRQQATATDRKDHVPVERSYFLNVGNYPTKDPSGNQKQIQQAKPTLARAKLFIENPGIQIPLTPKQIGREYHTIMTLYENFRKAEGQVDRFQQENKRFMEELQGDKERIERLKSQLAAQQREDFKLEALQADMTTAIDDTEDHIRHLQDRVTELEEDCMIGKAKIRELDLENSNLQEEKANLEGKLCYLETEETRTTLVETIKKLVVERRDFQKLYEQYEACRSELAAVTEKEEESQKQHENNRRRINELQGRLTTTQGATTEPSREKEYWEKLYREKHCECDMLQKELEKLQAEIKRSYHPELEYMNQDLEIKLSQATRLGELLREELADSQQKVFDWKQEYEDLQKRYSKEGDGAKERIEDLERDIAEIVKAYTSLAPDKNNDESLVMDMEAQIVARDQELEDRRRVIERQNEQIASMYRMMSELGVKDEVYGPSIVGPSRRNGRRTKPRYESCEETAKRNKIVNALRRDLERECTDIQDHEYLINQARKYMMGDLWPPSRLQYLAIAAQTAWDRWEVPKYLAERRKADRLQRDSRVED